MLDQQISSFRRQREEKEKAPLIVLSPTSSQQVDSSVTKSKSSHHKTKLNADLEESVLEKTSVADTSMNDLKIKKNKTETKKLKKQKSKSKSKDKKKKNNKKK